MSDSIHRRVLLLGVLSLVVAGVGVTQVSGAIPNPSDAKFYACFKKKSGVVKVVNYPKVSTCPKGQKLIDWGRTGPQGPAGAQGAQGAPGAQGVPGTAGITKIALTTVQAAGVPVADNAFGLATATCPAGKVVGGGHNMNGTTVDIIFYQSRPSSATQWTVGVWNSSGFAMTLFAYAVCMTTDPGTVIASKKSGFRPAGKVVDPAKAKRGR
jgi:hypothetical protein